MFEDSVPEETKTETKPFPLMGNWKPLNRLKKGLTGRTTNALPMSKGLPLQEMARLLREPTNPKPGFFVFTRYLEAFTPRPCDLSMNRRSDLPACSLISSQPRPSPLRVLGAKPPGTTPDLGRVAPSISGPRFLVAEGALATNFGALAPNFAELVANFAPVLRIWAGLVANFPTLVANFV